MVLKFSDHSPDSWFQIARKIQNAEHPNQADLITALNRQEAEVPPEAQVYLAKLLAGEIDRRGRPGLPEYQKLDEAHFLVRRVNRWRRVFKDRYKASNPQQSAFDKVAKERRGWSAKTAERNYRKAKKLLAPWQISTTDAKLKKTIARYKSAGLASRGQKGS